MLWTGILRYSVFFEHILVVYYIILILSLSTCYKVIENSRPHVYTEKEIYKEQECLGLAKEAIQRVLRFCWNIRSKHVDFLAVLLKPEGII